jgi:hypothetical protein
MCSHLSSLKLSNLMTPPHLLYLSLPTLFIDVESAETTLKTLRNRLCYHFRRAPRTMESHFSSYALMQLSSPHTHSPSPNTPPNLLLFILDLKSTEKLENERSCARGPLETAIHAKFAISPGRHPPFLNFLRESRGMPYRLPRRPLHTNPNACI